MLIALTGANGFLGVHGGGAATGWSPRTSDGRTGNASKEPTADEWQVGDQYYWRYSWIQFYTPVNEMYVTARMSALEGAWNEQLRSEQSFVTALRHVAKASVLIMQAIRVLFEAPSPRNPLAPFTKVLNLSRKSPGKFRCVCPGFIHVACL